jgi:signal transduction histidine kinase
LLEVYLPIRTPSGTPLLFEAYYDYSLVARNGSRLWRSFAPISLGALLMLELVQIPIVWALARRLRMRLRERELLLHRALEASDVERRQIASDLHDGAVQNLAGVAYALSATARRERAQGASADAKMIDDAAESIRDSIRSLRSLIVDIYPPDFDDVSFESAMTDLLPAGAIAVSASSSPSSSKIRCPTRPPGCSIEARKKDYGTRLTTRKPPPFAFV